MNTILKDIISIVRRYGENPTKPEFEYDTKTGNLKWVTFELVNVLNGSSVSDIHKDFVRKFGIDTFTELSAKQTKLYMTFYLER